MPYKNIDDRRRNARERAARKRAVLKSNPVTWLAYRNKQNEYARSARKNNPTLYRAFGKKHGPITRARLVELVLSHYGKQCFCCGETNKKFLTIDHINNDGAKQRRELTGKNSSAGWNFYHWLKTNDFPSGYRTACYNCNCGRWRNGGICPHQISALQ